MGIQTTQKIYGAHINENCVHLFMESKQSIIPDITDSSVSVNLSGERLLGNRQARIALSFGDLSFR
jgi:hypothetical protein